MSDITSTAAKVPSGVIETVSEEIDNQIDELQDEEKGNEAKGISHPDKNGIDDADIKILVKSIMKYCSENPKKSANNYFFHSKL